MAKAWFSLLRHVFERVCVPDGRFTGAERIVLVWLAKATRTTPYEDGTYQARYTPIPRIAQYAGVGEGTVKRALAKAEAEPEPLLRRRPGGITVDPHTGRFRRSPTTYVWIVSRDARSGDAQAAWTLTVSTRGIVGGSVAPICRRVAETWPDAEREAVALEGALREQTRQLVAESGYEPEDALRTVLRRYADAAVVDAITVRVLDAAA